MNRKGNLYIVSAPSGAGKTTLCKILMDTFSDIDYSVSHTTREPRKGETDGLDYFFISEEEFKAMIKKEKLAEWAQVHGNYYGTSIGFINKNIEAGRDILMDIDVKGTKQIVKKYPDAITIFIMPPSMEALRERLVKRGLDNRDVIEKRMKNAAAEIAEKDFYRHIVVNDTIDDAIQEMNTLIKRYR